MTFYQAWIWVSPICVKSTALIEAANLERAWEILCEDYDLVLESHRGAIRRVNANGKNGRVYRRKAKIVRLQ